MIKYLSSFSFVLLLSGCFLFPNKESETQVVLKPSVTISSGSGITTTNEVITLKDEKPTAAVKRGSSSSTSFNYTINYIAQALPVVVQGKTVQAVDIIIAPSGKTAYISYNYAGEEFRGALQIIDITNSAAPKIITEIQFTDIDVNCLYLDGNNLLFGGASNPDVWSGNRSIIGTIDINKAITPERVVAGIKAFPESYGVTGIAKKGSNYYVGLGAKNGGIMILDSTLTKVSGTSFLSYPDIRDIQEYTNGVVALKGAKDDVAVDATGSAIILDNNDNATILKIGNLGTGENYTKATLHVESDGIACFGLSELGLRVYDLKTSTNLFNLPNPDNDSFHTTNGVSSDGILMFTANGTYGFRVLKIVDAKAIGNGYASVVGYASFSNPDFSANIVEYSSNYLFVASGLGGVNIYKLGLK